MIVLTLREPVRVRAQDVAAVQYVFRYLLMRRAMVCIGSILLAAVRGWEQRRVRAHVVHCIITI